jgi:radical SAM superfamily enzyme YgiQ (UPF0313 family)
MNVLIFRLKNFVAEENRFGYREWPEMPAAMPLIGAYLRRKGFNAIISDHELGAELPLDHVDVVVAVIPLCDGLPHGLTYLKEAKERGKTTVLATYDDWETVQRDILINYPFIDYGLRGVDREIALERLLNMLAAHDLPQESTPGLVIRRLNEVIDGGILIAGDDLSHLQSCVGELTELGPSNYQVFFVRAASGCPFKCTYCHIGGRTMRVRPPEDVAEEMALVPKGRKVRLGTTDMLLNRAWAEKLLENLLEKGSRCYYDADFRADSVIKNADLLPLLRRTGCIEVVMGGESFHPKVLKATRKGITVDQYEDATKLVIDAGISPSFTMMLGYPQDSNETLRETYRRTESLPSEVVINGFQYLRPLPGSEVEKECLEKGLLKMPLTYRDFIYARNHPVVPTLHLTHEELEEWMARFAKMLAKREADRRGKKLVGPRRWVSRFASLGRSGMRPVISRVKAISSENDQLKRVRSLSPNSILLYRHLISFWKSKPRMAFVKPGEIYNAHYPDKVSISLRHDVDFYPDQLELFARVEEDLGLRSVIYIIFDSSHYDPEDHGELFRALHEKGFAIGLRTLALTSVVPLVKFADERERFKEVVGQYPKFFTIHGISPHSADRAESLSTFMVEVESYRKRWGLYPCSHANQGLRIVEDSGEGGEFGFLREEFFRIHEFPLGTKVELLTHPEHWVEHPVPWSIDEAKRFSWRTLIQE